MSQANADLAEAMAWLKLRESELVSLIDEMEHIDPTYPIEKYVSELDTVRASIKNLTMGSIQ